MGLSGDLPPHILLLFTLKPRNRREEFIGHHAKPRTALLGFWSCLETLDARNLSSQVDSFDAVILKSWVVLARWLQKWKSQSEGRRLMFNKTVWGREAAASAAVDRCSSRALSHQTYCGFVLDSGKRYVGFPLKLSDGLQDGRTQLARQQDRRV